MEKIGIVVECLWDLKIGLVKRFIHAGDRKAAMVNCMRRCRTPLTFRYPLWSGRQFFLRQTSSSSLVTSDGPKHDHHGAWSLPRGPPALWQIARSTYARTPRHRCGCNFSSECYIFHTGFVVCFYIGCFFPQDLRRPCNLFYRWSRWKRQKKYTDWVMTDNDQPFVVTFINLYLRQRSLRPS